MAGETAHVTGREGVARAKAWLERTGRVDVHFTVYDGAAYMTFQDEGGGSFAFDLYGTLSLDEDKAMFYAEVKKCSGVGTQPQDYERYLAQCYQVARTDNRPYHFMWITWHPFSQSKWTKLCTAKQIRKAVTKHKPICCGADQKVDKRLCAALADRLWLIVLSDRQEQLSMSDAMLGDLRKLAAQRSDQ